MAVAAQNVMAQRDLVGSVFAAEGKSKSATRPKVNKKDPWANTPRLNILLLGADDGAGRDGIRTDTVMVASIDTKTGDTALVSLSRNFMRMPFPEDSPLHDEYPDGFWDPSRQTVSSRSSTWTPCTATSRRRTRASSVSPTTRAPTSSRSPSARRSVSTSTTTCRSTSRASSRSSTPSAGSRSTSTTRSRSAATTRGPSAADDILPRYYLTPGANKKLNGLEALWFARGRYGLSDPSRQERQRCTIKAIVDSAQPATLVTKYQQIASASKKLLRTDIPQEILPSFIELGLKVKNAKVTNVDLDKDKNFPNGRDPDYEAMRRARRQGDQAEDQAGREPVHPDDRDDHADQEAEHQASDGEARRHRRTSPTPARTTPTTTTRRLPRRLVVRGR